MGVFLWARYPSGDPRGGAQFLMDEAPLYSCTPEALLQPEYRGTSLTRNSSTLGPESSPMPMALWCS